MQNKQLEGIAEATLGLLFGQDKANAGKYAYLNGGGVKFDAFIRNNENYLTFWKESEILQEQGSTIAQEVNDAEHVIIVGQGSALSDKEWHVIKHLENIKKITFIDLAEKFNAAALKEINDYKPEMKSKNIEATAITGRYQDVDKKTIQHWNKEHDKTLVMCVGSLITNIEKIAKDSYPENETHEELREIFRLAGNNGYAVIGYNAIEKQSTLQRSYANDLLGDFMLNALHFMAMNTPDLRIEDINGNPLDKNDRETINDLFEYVMEDAKFDTKTRNYAHEVRAKKSFKIFCSLDDPDQDQKCKDIEAGAVFTMMNSYQSSTSIINTLVKNISHAAKAYDVSEILARGKDNINIHSFRITPKVQQPS